MEKRILVISWFYPPVNSSEGLVTYKLLKKSKYEYDVFTQKNSSLWSYNNKDELPESKNVKSIYAKANNLQDWVEEATEYIRQNKEKYDIIMTRSMPPESHKIGLRAKEINPELKWIASFGDPIADNPYTKMSIVDQSPYTLRRCSGIRQILSPKRILKNILFKVRYKKMYKRTLYKDSKLQEKIIKDADYLIFNSEYQKDYMLQSYSDNIKQKAVIVNHSFDSSLYPEKTKDNQKLKFTYVGHLDDYRNPHILFCAINGLYKEDPNLADKVEFNFYGHMGNMDKIYIIDHELTDIIKVHKPVKYLESLKIMKESDWLIQIDANISSIIKENIFFAAKLADYIGTDNKIFGITMLEGISADILRKLNAITTSYSSEEVKNYLWLILYKGYSIKMNEEYRQEFDSNNVAKKFDKFIETKLL